MVWDKKVACRVTHSANGAALSSLCDRYEGGLGSRYKNWSAVNLVELCVSCAGTRCRKTVVVYETF